MCFYAKIKSWNIQKSINLQFSILGGIIARRPFFFLIIPIIISVALSTGVLWMDINRDHEWLYTDTNGKAAENKKLVEKLFPFNTSIYNDLIRLTAISNNTVILLTAKDGGSILREDVIREVAKIDNIMRSIEVEWRGRFTNYSVLCGKTLGKCTEVGLHEFISNFQKIRDGKFKIKYPVFRDKLTYQYTEYVSLLGGVKLDDDGYVKDVKALRICYFFDFSDRTKLGAIDKWQNVVYNYFVNKDFKYTDFTIMNKLSNYKSTEALTLEILKVMPIILGTIMLFSAFTCMTDEWVTSKPWLGLSACLSAILANISGFGLGFYLGIQYQDSYLAITYVVLANEVDDAFVLISSWRNTNPTESVPKRMEQTFYDTVTSITVTSLTNVLSCSIGIATSVPAFRMLCSMTVCCSFFAYIYQISFFGAFLALSGYSEENNACSIVCARKKNRRKKTEVSSKSRKGDIFMLCFRNSIGNLLTYPKVKAIVVLAFLANLATAMWGWTHIKFGMGMDDIFPADSFASEFLKMDYKSFDKYTTPIHLIIKDTLNYADSEVQSSIDTLTKQLGSHPHIAESSVTISWLSYYKSVVQNPVGKILFNGYNMSDKQEFIDGLHDVFLRMKASVQFKFDIVFNENYTDIVASRFLFVMKDINSTDTEITAIESLYEIVSKSNLPVEIFGLTIRFLEQAWIIKSMTLQVACIAVGLSCLVFFVFSQNIRSSLCVTFVVLCVICEMVGYFSLWGVRIDLASLTIFLVSIGFSINYPAHMAFAFVTDSNIESGERIKHAVYRIGVPLIQGAFSTIFGLSVVMFQQNYILIASFKILCLIALLTTFHSLIVIPVFLDLIGIPSKPPFRTTTDTSVIPLFPNKKQTFENNSENTSL